MAREELGDVKQTLQRMKHQLVTLRTHLSQIADGEKDSFNKLTYKLLSEYTVHIGNLTMMVEAVLEDNVTMKEQIDLLRNIVFEMPEVKKNAALQKKINAALKDHQSKHSTQ